MNAIEQKLRDLAITVPEPPKAVASYVPALREGDFTFVSGQLPLVDGVLAYKGQLGKDLTLEQGQAAARACAINLISQIKAACAGDLTRVRKILRLGGFVASVPEFSDQHLVMNAASNLMVEVFGEAGRHVRTAVGTNVLPLNAAVEVEAIVLLA